MKINDKVCKKVYPGDLLTMDGEQSNQHVALLQCIY